jgi:hypothetical protein
VDENVAANFVRKKPTPTTAQIIKKLKTLIWARLEAMEGQPMADGEAMRLLDGVMRSVTKLAEHEKRTKVAAVPAPRSSKAMIELRKQIADRIEQLNQG